MPDIRSTYTDSVNFFGDADPRSLVKAYGSPLYVYNEAMLRRRCRDLMGLADIEGFGVNYSVKANTNPHLLSIIREEGLVVDAMSPGELYMDRLAGFSNDEIIYISNNISPEEMAVPIESGLLVSIDSLSQLELYGRLAGKRGRVMLRVNPGIGAGHHDKVVTAGKKTKFGIAPDDLGTAFNIMKRHGTTLEGLNQHIGSLFMEPDDYIAAAKVLLGIVDSVPAPYRETIKVIDFGGGFGIPYHKYEHEERLDLARFKQMFEGLLLPWKAANGYAGRFLIEPGRYVVAECGLVLGNVEAVKHNASRRYAGTNLGFSVLVRPMMYDSFHDIEIYSGTPEPGPRPDMEQTISGNICESGDLLAKDRLLPEMREGDIVAALDAGAYGYVMASTYNQRPRPAEVLVKKDGKPRLIRRRETFTDLAACIVK